MKRHGAVDFEVSQGSYDGAECSELVGLYLLAQIHTVIPKEDVGLYRDDGIGYVTPTDPKVRGFGRN